MKKEKKNKDMKEIVKLLALMNVQLGFIAGYLAREDDEALEFLMASINGLDKDMK